MAILILVVVSILVFWFVAAPVGTFLHELGHGVAAVLLVPGRTTVLQGADPPLLSFRVGRLDFRLRPIVGPAQRLSRPCGLRRHRPDPAAKPRDHRGEPVASLLAFGGFLAIAVPTGGLGAQLAWIGAAAAAYQFVMTAIPMRCGRFAGPYAGEESDGLSIVRLLRNPGSETSSARR